MSFWNSLKQNLKWIGLPTFVLFTGFEYYSEGGVLPMTALSTLVQLVLYILTYTILQSAVLKLMARATGKRGRSG
jgi:hypothetical protein